MNKVNAIKVQPIKGGKLVGPVKTCTGGRKLLFELDAELLGADNLKVDIKTPKGTKTHVTKTIKSEKISSSQSGRTTKMSGEQRELKHYKFLKSKGFTGALAILQVVNLYSAFADFRDNETDYDYIRDFVNFGSTSFSLYSASIALDKSFGEVVFNFSPEKITLIGRIGNVLSALVCVIDSYRCFSRKDTDAGIMFGIAAGGFVLVAVGYGLIGGIIILVALTLAYVFTDGPLEYFFKHFLLSDSNLHPKLAISIKDTPMNHTRNIIKHKKVLVDDSDQEFSEPSLALRRLLNLISLENFYYYSTELKKQNYFISAYGRNKGLPICYYKEFVVKINFNSLLRNEEQIKDLTAHVDKFPINLKDVYKRVITLDNGMKQLKLSFVLRQKDAEKSVQSSKLFVGFRLKVSNNLYFPFSRSEDSEKRFICVVLPIQGFVGGNIVDKKVSLGFLGLKDFK